MGAYLHYTHFLAVLARPHSLRIATNSRASHIKHPLYISTNHYVDTYSNTEKLQARANINTSTTMPNASQDYIELAAS